MARAPFRPRTQPSLVRQSAVCLGIAASCSALLSSFAPQSRAAVVGIHKIQHVVMIMQENRSYDTYFGTYPGGKGIPPGVCLPDPAHGGCVKPFYNGEAQNAGGPHGSAAATNDVDG